MRRVRAEVLNARRIGAYHSITIVAPEVAGKVRPGQFVSVAMPPGRTFLLRRQFSIHQASRRGGWAGTLEFVFDPRGPGTTWLAEVKAHQFLDVIGPLGKAFAYPAKLAGCLLVAEGHGSAPLYFLGQELRARGKRVDMLVGAETEDQVFKPIEGKRLSQTILITTDDGSLGEKGTVLDHLPGVVESTGAKVIYAAGQRPMLSADTLSSVSEHTIGASGGALAPRYPSEMLEGDRLALHPEPQVRHEDQIRMRPAGEQPVAVAADDGGGVLIGERVLA